MTDTQASGRDISKPASRGMYALFCGLALYFTAKGDYGTAASNLAIALIFDPFGGKPWQQRPRWQQVWLVVHLAVLLGLVIWSVWR